MKKKISALLTILFLMFALCTTALAAEDGIGYVIDTGNLLTYDEWETLENRAQDISQRTNCGVYIVTLDDYTNYGSGEVYDVTTQIFNNADNGFGLGTDRNGILLLVSMADRDWAMFVHGDDAEYAFDSYGQAMLEDSFLPDFSEDNWYGGFSGYITACDEYLSLAASGEPVRKSAVQSVIPVICGSCIIALVICLIQKSKMKSVRRKTEAHNYTTFGGLTLTGSYDRYTHTTESVRSVEKNSSSAESGGGGSGRSGKF